MKANSQTKFKLSQKAHKRAIKKLDGKNCPEDIHRLKYHKAVFDVQNAFNRKLTKNEKQKIMNNL